jgi:hypothetical protein
MKGKSSIRNDGDKNWENIIHGGGQLILIRNDYSQALLVLKDNVETPKDNFPEATCTLPSPTGPIDNAKKIVGSS